MEGAENPPAGRSPPSSDLFWAHAHGSGILPSHPLPNHPMIVQGLCAVILCTTDRRRYFSDQHSRRLDLAAAERTHPRWSPQQQAGDSASAVFAGDIHPLQLAATSAPRVRCPDTDPTVEPSCSATNASPGGPVAGNILPTDTSRCQPPKCAGLPFLGTNSSQGADISVFTGLTAIDIANSSGQK